MIRYIAPTLTFLLGLGIGVAATYGPTREKWRALGAGAGSVAARGEVLDALCGFAGTGAPANRPDWAMDVKSERVELYDDGAGSVRVYCAR